MFSMQSVPRLYKEEELRLPKNLETVVRRVELWSMMVTSLVISQLEQWVSFEILPASKDVNTEGDETTALEAFTRRQPGKV
jgi:hypothetical protein